MGDQYIKLNFDDYNVILNFNDISLFSFLKQKKTFACIYAIYL